MRDTITTLFRASRTAPRAAIAAMLLAVACGLGGCAGSGAVGGSFAMASGSSTVAFESIDGPPPHVFDRMVEPGAKLSLSPGQPRPHHDRMGLGCI